MRKIITLTLLIAFSSLSILPQLAFANEAITAQKATEIVKSIIQIPDKEIKEFRSNYSEYDKRGTWQLYWTTEEGNISVYLDASSGEITQLYRHQDSADNQGSIYIIDKEKAIKLAENFFSQVIPSKKSDLRLVNPDKVQINKHNQTYTFNYYRTINNIPFKQNSAYITISARSGEVTSYNLNWDYNLEFVQSNGIIGQEKAAQILKDNAFELMYHKIFENEKPKLILVYGNHSAENSLVNAHTGEYTDGLLQYARVAMDKEMAEMGGNVAEEAKLNPIEIKEIEAIKGLLSRDEAINLTRRLIDIPNNYEISSANLYQDYWDKEKRTWTLEWQLKAEGENGYISVQIDAKTKEVVSFYLYENIPDRHLIEANFKPEEALKFAEEFVGKLQPHKFKQVKLNKKKYEDYIRTENMLPIIPRDKEITLEFVRYENDIPLYTDNIKVSVDLITGKVTSFNCSWSELNFPNPSNIINLNNAFDSLQNQNKISLEYMQMFNNTKKTDKKKVNLYYHFSDNEPKFVDAFTGKLLNNNGQEHKKHKFDLLTDIDNHPAEKDIKLLFDLGVITGEQGKFYPDNTITNAEFIKMLVLASNYYPGEGKKIDSLNDEWYAPYYQTAVYRKIIDKNNLPEPNVKLTRINLAHMVVRAMNIDYLASLSDIYLVNTKDAGLINKQDKGYVAITTKLGLIKLNAGEFVATQEVLKGETATTLVEYMKITKR